MRSLARRLFCLCMIYELGMVESHDLIQFYGTHDQSYRICILCSTASTRTWINIEHQAVTATQFCIPSRISQTGPRANVHQSTPYAVYPHLRAQYSHRVPLFRPPVHWRFAIKLTSLARQVRPAQLRVLSPSTSTGAAITATMAMARKSIDLKANMSMSEVKTIMLGDANN
jgi:hypothetical protein